jgi:DNA-binding protein HU-beta
MNKQEAVKAIAESTGLTQVAVNKVINGLESLTHEVLGRGEKLQLTGFINIKPAYRAARKGFDPLKNEAMEIAETVGVSVKAGEKLKTATKQLDVANFRPAPKAESAE